MLDSLLCHQRRHNPFHVIRLAGDALDNCRRRIQQATCGHRGRAGDPLYKARRTLHTGADLLTEKQRARWEDLFASDAYVEVEATWGIYQRMIAAYREKDHAQGKKLMQAVVDSVSTGVPTVLTELRTLGRTLKRWADDVLAYFDRPGTSNGPTEAVQWPARTPPRICPRLPQPHQLRRQITARIRRVQTETTLSILKSLFCYR